MKTKLKHYPSKTTVNLVVRKRTPMQTRNTLIGIVVFVLFLSVFTKFAVIDRLALAAEEEKKAEHSEQMLRALQKENESFDEVQQEYVRYFSLDTAETREMVDSLAVLTLVESEISPRAKVSSLVLEKNVLTLELADTDLNRMSSVMMTLTAHEMVEAVEIETAENTEETAGATIMLTITLHTEGGEGA